MYVLADWLRMATLIMLAATMSGCAYLQVYDEAATRANDVTGRLPGLPLSVCVGQLKPEKTTTITKKQIAKPLLCLSR